MTINALGCVEIRTQYFEEWADYGSQFLGMQLVDRSRSGLVFRMDDQAQRFIVTKDIEESFVFAWQVSNAQDLEALATRLEAAQVIVQRLSAIDCEYRQIEQAIAFCDPAGNRLQAFCGARLADTPFTPGRPITGFRAGTTGMGHGVLHVKNLDDVMWFYVDVLGFKLTDYTLKPYRVFFFHLNSRHHSLAMVESGKTGIHHIMLELCNLDDVGQGYDLAQAQDRIGVTLGRHTNDFVTSFYAYTPSKFMVEYGWGGVIIDPHTWQPRESLYGSSFWGHDRTWMDADDLAQMRQIRASAAAVGLHAPVQVFADNYEVAPGITVATQGVMP